MPTRLSDSKRTLITADNALFSLRAEVIHPTERLRLSCVHSTEGPDGGGFSSSYCAMQVPPWDLEHAGASLPPTLAERAALVLNTADPLAKAALSHRIFRELVDLDTPLGLASAPEGMLGMDFNLQLIPTAS